MTADELTIIKDIRRFLDKRPIDSSRVDIQVLRSRAYLTGSVKVLRSQPNVDIKWEFDEFEAIIRKRVKAKEIFVSVRLIIAEKKEKEEEHGGHAAHAAESGADHATEHDAAGSG